MGYFFEILGCVGVIKVIVFWVRVNEVRVIVNIGVKALFANCVLRGVVWGS